MKKNNCQPAQHCVPSSLIKILFSLLLCVSPALAVSAQYKSLASFSASGAALPYYESLVQGIDGNLYGTTISGGTQDDGTVFKASPTGAITVIYSFCALASCADGEGPFVGLALGTDGNFYGTTFYGGANNFGTVFKITSAGVLTTLHSFADTDGAAPWGTLVQGSDGNFYGTTSEGGTNRAGTVFKITSTGTFTNLYNFCSLPGCTDGQSPRGGLIQAGPSGLFYGVTTAGGLYGDGFVYSFSSTGTLTSVFSFDLTDGYAPYGSLLEATNGDFYGTTSQGGGSQCPSGCGTVFQIVMPDGPISTLHFFEGSDGSNALGTLTEGTDGNIYGTTEAGGANSSGTIFQVTTGGTFTTLYNFCSQPECSDGADPYGGVVEDTSGNFYGANSDTFYGLSVKLGPFVRTIPSSGKVGQEVGILGTSLTGAASVTFNGIAAKYSVTSGSLILTHVPVGATSGNVQVTVAGKTLTSNVPFTVVP